MYYRARYYNPNIGRFVSEDPVRFAQGPNFYVYVGNNSIARTDPSGLRWNKRDWWQPLLPPVWFAWCYDCALSQYLEGNARFPDRDIHNHMRHCWTSCQVSKRCSTLCFSIMSNLNETRAPEIRDFVSNAKGSGVALRGEDCEEGCRKCDPSAPPATPPSGPPPDIPR